MMNRTIDPPVSCFAGLEDPTVERVGREDREAIGRLFQRCAMIVKPGWQSATRTLCALDNAATNNQAA